MRLFVAIELDDRTRAAVAAAGRSLRFFGDGSFCPEDSYHITLAFIGESDRAQDIAAAMESVMHGGFSLSLGDVGHFGSTYYVALQESTALNAVQGSLCAELRKRGFKLDSKPFTPHVTLVRRFEKRGEPVVLVPERSFSVRGMSLMATVSAGVYRRIHYRSFVG
ncbi:MAG: RNA 2',3'-cyclic phosphodiesterase [Clostridia bacterium]|nr:RNA 2',3'-cyclic phosphodiesterase [Clostridia bacterium]